MADDTTVEIICPEVELLTEIETNLLCSVNGCSKVLPNASSLRMHLIKTHNVISNAKENEMFDKGSSQHHDKNNARKKALYCCPVDGCVRGRNAGRPFSRLAHVKQHYMTVHGEKKYACKNCTKKFGRSDACLRHEKACGKIFPCSCGCPFNSRTSMLTHAKRNGHAVPECEITKGVESHAKMRVEDKSLSDSAVGPPLCISVLPVVDKKLTVFRPLRPKKLLTDAETQTEQPCFCANDTARSLVQNDKSITVDIIPYPRTELGVSCEYTQTMQDEAYTQTSFIADEQHFDMDFTMDNSFGTNEEFKEHANSQTQTTLELTFDGFPLFEDNETQTLDSYLGFDPSNITIDCATQTKNIFDEIFSVDNETQTLLPVIDFVEEQLGDIHCNPGMDSQTQTLENIYLNSDP